MSTTLFTFAKPFLEFVRDSIGSTKVFTIQDPTGNTVQFSLVKETAHGASANIFKSYQNGELVSCAVKRIKGEIFEGHEIELRQMLDRERLALEELSDSVFITKFIAFYEYKPLNEFWVCLEYCDGGSITCLLKQKVDFKRIAAVIAGVMKALAFIHSRGYIHGDIKCGNILMCTPGIVKVCDFGLASKVRNVRNPDFHALGTIDYMSPEVMLKSIALDEEDPFAETYLYDHKIDVWALGIVVLELLIGNPPLHALKRENEEYFSYYIAKLLRSRASERGSAIFDLFFYKVEVETRVAQISSSLDREKLLRRVPELNRENNDANARNSNIENPVGNISIESFLAELLYNLSIFKPASGNQSDLFSSHFTENVKHKQNLYQIIKCLSLASCCLLIKKDLRPEIEELSKHQFVKNQYKEFSSLESEMTDIIAQSKSRQGRKSIWKDYSASLTMHEIQNIIQEQQVKLKEKIFSTAPEETTNN